MDPPAHDGSNEDEQAHDHLPSLSNKDEDSNKDDNEEEVASNVDPEDDEEEEAPEHPFAITKINDNEVEFEENETSEEQLARLVEAGPPGDEPLRLAALDFMEAKKAYWQAKEADETQEALSEKIANLKKQKKFYLAMLEFRNKHATLNKATEFRTLDMWGSKVASITSNFDKLRGSISRSSLSPRPGSGSTMSTCRRRLSSMAGCLWRTPSRTLRPN